MSKNKSLGSSPIEFRSNKSSMGFIPDLGVSKKKKESTEKPVKTISKASSNSQKKESNTTSTKPKKTKKKIVSYYLEMDLIEEVKSIADQKDMYYSALVTMALENWLSTHS